MESAYVLLFSDGFVEKTELRMLMNVWQSAGEISGLDSKELNSNNLWLYNILILIIIV